MKMKASGVWRRQSKGLVNLTPEQNVRRLENQKAKQRKFQIYRDNLLTKNNANEDRVLELLKKLPVRFIREKGVLTGSDFCIADFFIRTPFYTVIEVDGSFHDNEKQKRRDAQKDKIYENHRYKCLRIHHTEMHTLKNEHDLLMRLI